jgi:AmmeMemoRadiSam system protein B
MSVPNPKVRSQIDLKPLVYKGQPYVLLRDPLGLNPNSLFIPQPLAPIIALCDGSRDKSAIINIMSIHFMTDIDANEFDYVIDVLDEAFLLENDRYYEGRERALEAYRDAPFRQPILAGSSYPLEQDQLKTLLDGYLTEVNSGWEDKQNKTTPLGQPRGLLSPHIDYSRGWRVYAKVWKAAQEQINSCDLAIIIGTNHFGGDDFATLTYQNYSTPYGVLPTDQNSIKSIAEVIGHDKAFSWELNHLGEHSIELAAVWLHHMRGGKSCDLIPILSGSVNQLIYEFKGDNHQKKTQSPNLVKELKRIISGRNTIVIATGDLSHVGPAFGGRPVDIVKRDEVKLVDDMMIQHMCRGDGQSFISAIQNHEDEYNVCGTAPIYLALNILAPSKGRNLGYEHCAADENNTSIVSICGMVFY